MSGISPLTIDVGTCQALSQGFLYNKLYVENAAKAINGQNTTERAAYIVLQDSFADAVTAEKTAKDEYNEAVATYGAASTQAASALTAYEDAQDDTVDAKDLLNATGANAVTDSLSTATVSGINENVNIAGVVIGLPTVEIATYHNKDTKTISLVTADATTADAGAVNAGKSFITIEKEGSSKMAILGGRIEIAPH